MRSNGKIQGAVTDTTDAATFECAPLCVSVVMPAYNEAERIAESIRTTVAALSKWTDSFEVIVVDDGSTDGTADICAAAQTGYDGRVRTVKMRANAGKGHAFLAGSWFARGDCVVLLDADMDIHPSQVRGCIEHMDEAMLDIVVASKWHPRSVVRYPFHRRFLSRGYFALTRLAFRIPVRDTQTGLKVFRRRVVENVFPKMLVKQFAFDIEILAVAHRFGFRVGETPVHVSSRRKVGRLRYQDGVRALLDTAGIYWRLHVTEYYDRLHCVWERHAPAATLVRDSPPESRIAALEQTLDTALAPSP
ncbi:MAG: glycosyltransferase [Vulcanimicrobiaceae bacterium]